MYKFPLSVWISIALTACISLYSLTMRYQVEQSNRAVAIVAETDAIKLLSAVKGIPYEDAVQSLKSKGLDGLVVSEELVSELIADGSLEISDNRHYRGVSLQLDDATQTVLSGNLATIKRVQAACERRFGKKGTLVAIPDGDTYLGLPIPAAAVRTLSVGLPESAIPKGYEGDVVVRLANPIGNSESYVRSMIAEAAKHRARYFLPSGEQVLGRKGNMKALVEALAENQMYYVSPEFAKIGGDEAVIAKIPERSVRLHAAQALELDKVSESGAIERYAKAATERNIRLLLVRPITNSATDPLGSFGDFIQKLTKQLEKEGLAKKSAHPYQDPNVPRWIFPALGLAVAPAAAYLLSLFGLRQRWLIAGAVILSVLGLMCWFDSARNYVALLAAITFPTLALTSLQGPKTMSLPLAFLVVGGLSMVGGLTVAGMLNGLPYMIRADQFGGVKLAHFAPIGIIPLLIVLRHSNWRVALQKPITWLQVALSLAVLIGLAFMATRTGNDNPAGVSGIELQFRALLEQFLVVRPRTKEMLIGYPALVVGLGMWLGCLSGRLHYEKWTGWSAIMLGVGSIGTTSLVNTLCHLHTPLSIGFTRILVGFLIGGALGSVVWLGIKRGLKFEGAHGD